MCSDCGIIYVQLPLGGERRSYLQVNSTKVDYIIISLSPLRFRFICSISISQQTNGEVKSIHKMTRFHFCLLGNVNRVLFLMFFQIAAIKLSQPHTHTARDHLSFAQKVVFFRWTFLASNDGWQPPNSEGKKGPANDNSSGKGETSETSTKFGLISMKNRESSGSGTSSRRGRSERAAHMKNPLFRNTPKVWWDSLVAIFVDGIFLAPSFYFWRRRHTRWVERWESDWKRDAECSSRQPHTLPVSFGVEITVKLRKCGKLMRQKNNKIDFSFFLRFERAAATRWSFPFLFLVSMPKLVRSREMFQYRLAQR